MIEPLIYGNSRQPPRLDRVSDGNICRENTYDEFR